VIDDTAAACAAYLAGSAAFRAKHDIARVAGHVDSAPSPVECWRERAGQILIGDDTAAIPDGEGYLLFAAEGMLPEFLDRDPHFAGWCSVMVNVSDVAAMGGFPLAVVDVYWHGPSSPMESVLEGIREACRAYGVPLVGGHTMRRSGGPHALAVAIVGRTQHLLTSFGALPGDVILYVVDLRGSYHADFPFWDASQGRDAPSLRGDLALLGDLAASGVVHACKDVSNAGVAGTLLMMLEASRVGGVLDLERIPRPPEVDPWRWLLTFPSYGFLLSVALDRAASVRETMRLRGLACEPVGTVDGSNALRLARGGHEAVLWDLSTKPFTGFPGP
jgi:AIR synthase-related protein